MSGNQKTREAVLLVLDGQWRSALDIALRSGFEGPDRRDQATRILGYLRNIGRADHNGRMGTASRWHAAWRYPAKPSAGGPIGKARPEDL